jgi:hypothetical protein
MKPEKDIYVEAIAKLIKLTQDKKIVWSAGNTNYLVNKMPSNIYESVYITNYKGKRLRIYKKYYTVSKLAESFLSQFSDSDISGYLGSESKSKPRTVSQVVLEIIDDKDYTVWEFPNLSITDNLLSSVIFQTCGVNELLNDLINE